MSETDQGLSAGQIARQIDASLKRLQTDYVDLYQAHRFDVTVPIEDTIEAFQRVVQQGKARYLGSDTMNFAQGIVYNDEALEAVQRLVPVARSAGLSLPTLALAWVLRRGEVAAAITGASRPEQVHANAQASGVELTGDVLAAIDAALGNAPVVPSATALDIRQLRSGP
jgi:aryl-alcohol dehydrogenase-like predicted oxidoreductase